MIRLVGNPKSQMFEVENGQKMSVFDYFKQHYKYTMKYPNLPCVQVGNPKSNIFLPLECLELKQQVCPQSKILGKVVEGLGIL
jgi:eukaryotic translation initiation factor 2C